MMPVADLAAGNVHVYEAGSLAVMTRQQVYLKLTDPFASSRTNVQPAGGVTPGEPRASIVASIKLPTGAAGFGTTIVVAVALAAEVAALNAIPAGAEIV